MGDPAKLGFVLVTALIALAAGCSDAEEPADDDAEVVVRLRNMANKTTVYDDRLELDADLVARLGPQLSKIDAYAKATDKASVEPVYLVSDRQTTATTSDGSLDPRAKNPTGFLRRALSWTRGPEGRLVIKTEHATLAETTAELAKNGFVLLDGDKRGGGDATEQPVQRDDQVTGLGNWQRTWSHAFAGPDGLAPLDLSGKMLFEAKLASGGSAKVMLTRGRIDLRPILDAQLSVQRFIPRSGRAIVATDLAGEIAFEVAFDATGDTDQHGTLLAKKLGGTIDGFPVTMSIGIDWHCVVASSGPATLTMGVNAKGSLRAGGELHGRTVDSVLDASEYTFQKIGPTVHADVKAKGDCHLLSTIALQVFDAEGPRVSVDLYSNFVVSPSSAAPGGAVSGALIAGIEANVGGALKPFGVSLAPIKAEPSKIERTLFDGDIAFDGDAAE